MQLLDEIEAYFAKQPEWQRRGYAALRSGQNVDDVLVAELAARSIEDASTSDKATPKITSASGLGLASPPDTPPVVCLLGIENVQHINRLAAGQALRLAPDGLTIVYGDNGAGKTGYERIVRQVSQARGETRDLILLYWQIGREFLRAQEAEGAA